MVDQATTTSNSSATSTKEIDVREALDILAARSCHHDHHHNHNHHSACHHVPNKDAVHWGQRIPLGRGQEAANNDDGDKILDSDQSHLNETIEQQKERIETERAKRRIAVEQQLNSMTVLELLQVVMSAR